MALRRAPYTPCVLFYDGDGVVLQDGHYLRTPAGSAYLITRARPSKTYAGRFNLACLRWPVDEIPSDAVVHELHWYSRDAKAAARPPAPFDRAIAHTDTIRTDIRFGDGHHRPTASSGVQP